MSASSSTRTRAGTSRPDGTTALIGCGDTVVLPRASMHQIFNAGDQTLEIVGVFGGSPVSTYLPDGSALSLPWRT